MSVLLAYNARLYIEVYLSIQNMCLWEDFLYKEIRSTLTVTNSNTKILHLLNIKSAIISYTINKKIVVLNSKPLRFKILKFIYNSPIAGHPTHIKTYKIV